MGQGALYEPVVQWWLSLNSSKCKRSSVIFDTGASMHVVNNGRYLADIKAKDSFKVYRDHVRLSRYD